ncbi:fibronectin type III domain-containing protein [Egicoccus sp. AB-alg6-2]|uniref:fibronectin type III domain-containing protein n=1 Tax=Egicoccus sp. AB-alg6-2 TaxID=3242692 RepID=UPI00359D09CC
MIATASRAALTGLLAVALLLSLATPGLAASPPLIPGESTGDDPDEAWWEGIVVPETGVLPAAETHPSLYFTADEIPELRARVAGDRPDPHGFYAGNWDRVVTDADRWLSDPVSDNDDVKTRASKALAFAWVITGDVRYRDHAVANLVAAFENLQTTDQYVAMQMTNYAVAYDWVMAEGVADDAPPIPATDVQAMRDAIKVGATWMDEYLDRPGVRSHNHRSKVGAAQGSWAMAFAEDPDAQAYLDKGMANLNRVWSYMFTADGIHRDGAGYYWIFTVINSTPFLWHYKNAAGQDLFPLLQPAFEWQLKTSNPKGWTPNIEDGWFKHTWLVTVASAYEDTPTDLHASASLGELFQWRFFATDHEPVRYPDDFTGARNQYYAWPDEIVLYDSSLGETQPAADTGTIDFDAGPRGGATVFRSDWDFARPHTRWAYFEGTAMSNNHDHADALQFIIDAENTILANDNGFGPQRFSGRNEWKGADNHNVITADGAALGDPDPTSHFLDTGFFDFAEKSAAYFDDPDARHTRALAFPGQDYFVVADTLQADTDKTWISRYHNRGELVGAANRWRWTTEAGPWGDAANMHAFVLPTDANVATAAGRFNPYGDGSNRAGAQYPDPVNDVEDVTKLEITQTGTQAQYLKVLVPGAVGDTAPAFDDLSVGDVLAARVTTDAGVDVFGSRATAGTIAADGVRADASFVWTRQVGDALQQVAGRDLTSVAVAGTPIATTDRAVALALDVADPRTWSGQLARDTDGPTELTLTPPTGRSLVEATLDGAPVTAAPAGDGVTLTLPAGGDLVVIFSAAEAAPDAPTGLRARAEEGGIALHWDATATAVDYEILRTVGDGDEAAIAVVDAPAHRDTDVTTGADHTYRVVARNEAGASAPSASVTVTAGLQAPDAPTGLQAVTSDGTVQLSWNRAVDADTYRVLRASGDGAFAEVAHVGVTAFTDRGLTNGTTYRYAVVAVNDAGESAPSEEVTARPLAEAPDAPTGVRTGRGSGEVTLRWDPTPRATSYDVARATTAGGPYTVVAEDLTDTAWRDTDVTDGTTYYYVVHAGNSSGTGPASREALAVAGCTPTIPIGPDVANYVEAEDHAVLAGAFEQFDDPERSGGAYLQSLGGGGAGSAPTGQDYLRFDLEVEEPGAYRVWLLAQGDDTSSDSFWIQVDAQEPFQAIMDNSRQWRWKTAASVAHLDGGFQTLTVHHRETGARIDKLLLVRDTGYTPTGLGGDALTPTPCEDACVEAYPVDGTELSFVEAENFQAVSGDIRVVTDAERSGGAYLQAGPTAPSIDPETDAWAAYELDVSVAGDYRMLALGYGPDSSSDSWWVAVDDAPPSSQFNLDRSWTWKLSTNPNRVTLPEGRVTLYLKARKPGSNVDKFLLTMSGHTPTGLGGDALPAPGCPDDEPEPQPPASPTDLSARLLGDDIVLSWAAAADADTYTVVRTQELEGGWEPVAEAITATTFTDDAVTAGETYSYAVFATNDDGDSRRSTTVTVTAGCTPHWTLGADAPLWIEAETTSASGGDWIVHEDDDRAGGGWIQLSPDAARDEPAEDWLRYDLEVTDTGDYALWYLGRGFDTNSDSLWLQVDGEPLVQAGVGAGDWNWRNPGTFTLTEGRHTLWFRNREPGAALDKLLLTADTGVRPSGLGDAGVTPRNCGPCAQPDTRSTVVVRGADTGVPNLDRGDGCTINDLIDDGPHDNHGRFVAHVSEVTEQLVADGVITAEQRDTIMRSAARRR